MNSAIHVWFVCRSSVIIPLFLAVGVLWLGGCAAPVYQPNAEVEDAIKRAALHKEHPELFSSDDRYYYVVGEVHKPGPEPYLGETSLSQAIAAARGLTEHANPKRVELRRAKGSSAGINLLALRGTNDPAIFPGDTIDVKRR